MARLECWGSGAAGPAPCVAAPPAVGWGSKGDALSGLCAATTVNRADVSLSQGSINGMPQPWLM